MRFRSFFPLSFILLGATVACAPALSAQANEAPMTSPEERAALHRSSDWALIASHLPDAKTASAADLETAADVLRARRFPEDALDYYGYAVERGGNVSTLLNKMGVVRLELRQTSLARQMFLRTVHVQKKNSSAWNNLGVTEYVTKNYGAAISDYRHAVKLDRRSAVYRSNLGMAYFENKDMESAREQFALAVKLDPSIMQGKRDGGGDTAHVAGTENYGQLCFEMAQIYAGEHKRQLMLLWLAKSAESGFDVRSRMGDSASLSVFRKDPEVVQILTNAAQMRAKNAPGSGIPRLDDNSRQQVN